MQPSKLTPETVHEAADMVLRGRPLKEIAARFEVTTRTVTNWRQLPEFTRAVEDLREDLRRRAIGRGAAAKENRILAKRKRIRAVMRALRKRAGKPEYGGAEWDETGLFVQRKKSIGGGPFTEFVTEFEFDAEVAQYISQLEREIAEEMGEFRRPPEKIRTEEREDEVAVALCDLFGSPEELMKAKARFLEVRRKRTTTVTEETVVTEESE